jgi:hypothetical protein
VAEEREPDILDKIGEGFSTVAGNIGEFFTAEADPEKILIRLRQGAPISEKEAGILAKAIVEGQVEVDPEELQRLSPQTAELAKAREADVAENITTWGGVGGGTNKDTWIAALKAGTISDEDLQHLAHSIVVDGDAADVELVKENPQLGPPIQKELDAGVTPSNDLVDFLTVAGMATGTSGVLPRFLGRSLGGGGGAAVAKALALYGRHKILGTGALATVGLAGSAAIREIQDPGAAARAQAQPQPGVQGTGQPGTPTTPVTAAPTGTTVPPTPGTTIVGYTPQGQAITSDQLNPTDVLSQGQPGFDAQTNVTQGMQDLLGAYGLDPETLAQFQGAVGQQVIDPKSIGSIRLEKEMTVQNPLPPGYSPSPRADYVAADPSVYRRGYDQGIPAPTYQEPGTTVPAGATINPKMLAEFNGRTLLEWAADAAARYDVPLNILYGLIEMESNWDPNAVGDNGTSFGLAQIHTPAFPEVTQDVALNPVYALNFAARNLHERFEIYGRWDAAVAAHNSPVAGEFLASSGSFQTAKSQDYVNNIFDLANASGLDTYKADAAGIEVSPELQPINVSPFTAPDPAGLRNYARDQYQTLLGRDPSVAELNSAVGKLTDLYRSGWAMQQRDALREQGLSDDQISAVGLTGAATGSVTPGQSGGLSYNVLPDVKDPGSESARNNRAHYEDAKAGEGIWGARAQFASYAAPVILSMFPGTVNWGQFRDLNVSASGAMSPTSDHYSGGALDIHGTPEQMEALSSWAQSQPWAANVIYGVEGHTDHVHISFKLGYAAPGGGGVTYDAGDIGQSTGTGNIVTYPDQVGVNPEEQWEEGIRTSGEFEFQSQQTKLRSMTDFAAEIARMLQTGSM